MDLCYTMHHITRLCLTTFVTNFRRSKHNIHQTKTKKCRNWDGGAQERDTAVRAVRDIFPNANITPKVLDSYPVEVKIEAIFGGTHITIWEGSQKDLFRKNGAKRTQTIEAIKNNLMKYKGDMGDSDY